MISALKSAFPICLQSLNCFVLFACKTNNMCHVRRGSNSPLKCMLRIQPLQLQSSSTQQTTVHSVNAEASSPSSCLFLMSRSFFIISMQHISIASVSFCSWVI